MKATEIFILSTITARGSTSVPAFKTLAEWTSLSISQCFDAVEGLYEAQLLDSDRRTLQRDPIFELFSRALPFIVPGKILRTGRGSRLSLSDSSATSPISSTVGQDWVWPFRNEDGRGLTIQPLHESLETILEKSPSLRDFFSCVEILRFRQHPLRAKAEERLLHAIGLLRAEHPSTEISADSDRTIEAASRVIAESGYRSIDFTRLAKMIGTSKEKLEERFGDPGGLSAEIGRACVARANAHLGKLMLSRPDNRLREARESLESFFKFLDVNEDYFRLGVWFYVERMFQVAPNAGHLADPFFEKLEEFFASIPSKTPPRARAVIFANSWLTYAWFRWVEYPRMGNRVAADDRLRLLRETLIELLGENA